MGCRQRRAQTRRPGEWPSECGRCRSADAPGLGPAGGRSWQASPQRLRWPPSRRTKRLGGRPAG
eukprot:8197566-Alexandrium_andersonii.AAC.1